MTKGFPPLGDAPFPRVARFGHSIRNWLADMESNHD